MADASSAISGVGAIAGAMGGGGGSSGGGAVVGGPSPAAAMAAGKYQANAAMEASKIAGAAVKDAMISINKNYQQARYDVQPYRQEGVQALNKLNQYLGLDAYNPGAAPTAPKKWGAADFSKKEINKYIKENSELVSDSRGSQHAQYTGAGAEELIAATPDYVGSWNTGPAIGEDPNQGYTIAGNTTQGYGISDFFGNSTINSAVGQELADEKNKTYDSEMEGFNRDQGEWAQNKKWYDEYTAAGPKTQDQITAEITSQPGYSAELNQGVDAIEKASSAKGYLGSGRALKELSQFGQNTLSKYYNNTLDRLSSLVQGGQNAATQSAGMTTQKGQLLAGLQQGLGDTQANAALAKGNAYAQAELAANQQYKIIGGSGGKGGMK